MKRSNLDRLLQRYICGESHMYEKIKIEVLLKEIESKGIHFLSEDTEELFFRKITNARISSDEIRMLFRNLSKLKVPRLNWLRLEAFEVYYYDHSSGRKR
jgi:hypothetical protein